MANCDFGRPCECRDCRTIYVKHKCKKCGSLNSLEVERASVGESYRGVFSYRFEKTEAYLDGKSCGGCGSLLS